MDMPCFGGRVVMCSFCGKFSFKDQRGGLQMYVNRQKVGHSFAPLPRPHSDPAADLAGRWVVASPLGPVAAAAHGEN